MNPIHRIELTPRAGLAVFQLAHLIIRTVCGLVTLMVGARMVWTDPMLSPAWTVTNWTSVAITIAGLWVLETVARDVHGLVSHQVTYVPVLGTAITHRFHMLDEPTERPPLATAPEFDAGDTGEGWR